MEPKGENHELELQQIPRSNGKSSSVSSSPRQNSVPVIKPWSSLPDRADSPYLSNPAVWSERQNHRLCLLVTRAILAVLKERGK